MLDKKDRIYYELIIRSIYLVLAVVSFLSTLGFWNIWTGTGGGFNVYFFYNYFDWTLIMSIVATSAALIEDIKILKSGNISFTKKFPLLKFCTFSGMIFGLILGAFVVDRIGSLRLTDSTAFGSIYPAIATKGYWLDFSLLSSMCICPSLYIVMYILFEEKGTTRPVYANLGIVPPTLFYLTVKIFGIIMKSVYGGVDNLIAAGKYGVAFPYFFYDDLTFSGWWWIILWPSIFGVILVTINRSSYIISRLKRNENGKVCVDKTPYNEDESTDMLHPLVVKIRQRKANKNKNK
ncbi:MAG: hypothetical protein K5765_09400 [Clostridia bacterium]|nr:hypothetical protein [Clostridia bacterium]